MSYCSPVSNSFSYYIDENHLFTAIASITFATVAVFWYILKSYTFFDKLHVVGRAVRPKAPFGNIKDVVFRKTSLYIYLWKYYNKFKRQGHKFGGFFLFLKPGILLVNPALTYRILTDEKLFVDVYRKNDVEECKKITRLFNSDVLRNLILKCNTFKNQFIHDIGDKSDFSSVVYDYLYETTSTVFGFKLEEKLKKIVNNIIEEKTASNLSHYFHLVYPCFAKKQTRKELKSYIQAVMNSRKKNDIREDDILQNYIDFINDNDGDLETLILDELLDVFIVNIYQTLDTVLFCLYEVASNSDIQQDLIGEIRRFNKANSSINLNNLHHLIYLEAVVKETLRKYPPISLVTKKSITDYTNTELEMKIPIDCLVFVSIYGIHHDPQNYSDPETFDPDRFFEDNIKFLKPNTYIPFAMDYRKNIGFSLTMTHIELCLFHVLTSFKVTLIQGRKKMELDVGKLSTSPKLPLPIKFEELSR